MIDADQPTGENPTKGPLRSILFATDFSGHAMTALGWARTLARAHGASLSILHVAPTTATASLPLKIQRQITERLDAFREELRDDGVEVTTQWRAGRPWEQISAEAQAHDVLVIGARGHTTWPHLRVGSTADRVLRTASVPVLTVHQEDPSFHLTPRRIVVPTDFSETATLAFDAAVHLFGITPVGGSDRDEDREKGLEITLLHAWQPLFVFGDPYTEVPPPIPYVETKAIAQEKLEALAAQTQTESIRVTPVVREGYPAHAIAETVAATDADLIAMGTHGHSGLARLMLGSIAERVIHRVHCPVLTVGSVLAGHETSMASTEATVTG